MKAAVLGVALASAGLVVGCKGGGAATPTERLWVSGVPTNPKAPLTAFLTMRTDGGDRYLGAFFQGSLLRGGHDVFEWTDAGKDRASVRFLQDDRKVTLTLSTCTAARGFDYCLEVGGNSRYAGKYQSRKRWVVRRPGRKRDAAAGMVTQALLELADDDDELAQALELDLD